MPHQYLLDTSTASYIIKGNPPAVRRHLIGVPMEDIAISSVTEGELSYGVARRPDPSKLRLVVDEFLVRVACMPWGSDAAHQYGQLRALLEREGRPIGNLDLMIAAHALALDAILVTNDQAFARIKKLKTEDWTRP